MSGSIFLEASEYNVNENGGSVTVSIIRTGDLSLATTIEYGTNPITATGGGVDYTDSTGQITMAAGQNRATVIIPIHNDTLSEATETFNFSLVNVSSGSLLFPRTALVHILDDENPVTPPAVPPLVSDYNVELQTVSTGYDRPIAIEFSPANADIAYVATKTGIISAFDIHTGQSLGTLLDISAKVNDAGDRGLMDIALDPNFATNHFIYAFYVVDPSGTVGQAGAAGADGDGNRFAHVARFTVDSSGLSINPSSEFTLLGGAGQSLSDISGGGAQNFTSEQYANQPSSALVAGTSTFKQDYIKVDSVSHAGGSLVFGPDGALYVTTGDGSSFDFADTRTLEVQSVDSLSGKVLRINPATGDGYADNPFATANLDANASKVYQLGLRNPFTATFDSQGHLFVSETGWFSYEEINTGPRGANFGWPYFEGGDQGVNLRTPIYQDMPSAAAFYAAVANGTINITGAFRAFSHTDTDPGYQVQAIVGPNSIYTGSNVYPPEFFNDYIFTDVVQGEIYSVDINNPLDLKYLTTTPSGFGPVHFKQGPDGYMYYADFVEGTIGRLLITPNGTTIYDIPNVVQTLNGPTGNDTFVINANAADYQWNATADGTGVVVYTPATYDILTNFEHIRFNDRIVTIDEITGSYAVGSNRNDVINLTHAGANHRFATEVADTIIGLGGNDYLAGGGGNDTINAGAGRDYAFGGNGNDNVFGGRDNDRVYGGNGRDVVQGAAGNDFVAGGEGDDTVIGGQGRDALIGNGGADNFVFNVSLVRTNADRIFDFQSGVDHIVLENGVFRAFAGLEGTLDAQHFSTGGRANAPVGQVIYNPANGALIYDSNGSHAGGATQFATLSVGLHLTADDFLIV